MKQNDMQLNSYAATKLFVSNLNARLAQRFLALVLLPAVRRDVADNKRLHFALFQALRKATYKPGAFYKVRQAAAAEPVCVCVCGIDSVYDVVGVCLESARSFPEGCSLTDPRDRTSGAPPTTCHHNTSARTPPPRNPNEQPPPNRPPRQGLLLPLCASRSCTLREAVIFTSVLRRSSLPALHSAAALLRLAAMEYCGTTSFFIRVLLDKKYALPYK